MTATALPADVNVNADGWPYRFKILEEHTLFVDDSYQRPLGTFAKKIAKEYDPAMIGVLTTSDRGDGSYAVVDGQTRLDASRKRGVKKLPCLVYLNLTQEQEASLFARLQKERRGIASFYRFRAALVAGDEEPTEIQKIVNECGYEVGLNTTGSKAVSAVAALEKVYRRDPAVLERTLLVLREAWKDRHAPNGDVLRGLSHFLIEHPGTDDEKLARRLSLATPDELKRRASALKEGSGARSGGAERFVGGAIEGIYRSGRS